MLLDALQAEDNRAFHHTSDDSTPPPNSNVTEHGNLPAESA